MQRLGGAEGDERAAHAVGGGTPEGAVELVLDAASGHKTEIEQAGAFGADAAGEQGDDLGGGAARDVGETARAVRRFPLVSERESNADERGEFCSDGFGASLDYQWAKRGGGSGDADEPHAGENATRGEPGEKGGRFVLDVGNDAGTTDRPGEQGLPLWLGKVALAGGYGIAVRIVTWMTEIVGEFVHLLGSECVFELVGATMPFLRGQAGGARELGFGEPVGAHEAHGDGSTGFGEAPAVRGLVGESGLFGVHERDYSDGAIQAAEGAEMGLAGLALAVFTFEQGT